MRGARAIAVAALLIAVVVALLFGGTFVRFNLALPVASTQQTIVVEVTPPTVDTDDSRLETTLSSNTVRDLPEANRNLWDVLAVAPGVVGTGTAHRPRRRSAGSGENR